MDRLRAAVAEWWQLVSAALGYLAVGVSVATWLIATMGIVLALVFIGGWLLIGAALAPRAWWALRPGLLLDCGEGAPFDDAVYGKADLQHQLQALTDLAQGKSDSWAFAKKVRVRSKGGTVRVQSVWLADSPIGQPRQLPWHSDGQPGERKVHPADENHFLLIPSGAFNIGTHAIRIELVREDRNDAESHAGTLHVHGLLTFPTIDID